MRGFVCFMCMCFGYMYTVYLLCVHDGQKEDIGSSGTEVKDTCEPPSGYWNKPTPSGKATGALNLPSYLSLTPQMCFLFPNPVTNVLLTELRVKNNPHTGARRN